MELSLKQYKTLQTKDYIKTNTVFFFFSGTNKNSNEWIKTEQELKKMEFHYYKVINKTAVKSLEQSIFTNVRYIVTGPTFCVKPNNKTSLPYQHLLNNFEPLLFNMLAIKFNNKVYPASVIKNMNSFSYKENVLLMCKFKTTHLKSYFHF